jgi:hypothetical protein
MEEFEDKGVSPDVIKLRYKYFQGKLMTTINRILDE